MPSSYRPRPTDTSHAEYWRAKNNCMADILFLAAIVLEVTVIVAVWAVTR